MKLIALFPFFFFLFLFFFFSFFLWFFFFLFFFRICLLRLRNRIVSTSFVSFVSPIFYLGSYSLTVFPTMFVKGEHQLFIIVVTYTFPLIKSFLLIIQQHTNKWMESIISLIKTRVSNLFFVINIMLENSILNIDENRPISVKVLMHSLMELSSVN